MDKKPASAVAAIIGIALVGIMFQAGCEDMCRNNVLAEYASPDGRWRTVVFQRDCGATTGFSIQVSLLRRGEKLSNDSGNVFVVDTGHNAAISGFGGGAEIQVRWESYDRLLILHGPRARVFKAEKRYSTVTVWYGVLS